MATFDYISTTRPTSLVGSMDGIVTTVNVVDGSSYPDPAIAAMPYSLILGYGTSREEVVTVTAKPTINSFTVTRGQDGTVASAKNAGDVVVHGVSARDFDAIATKVAIAGDFMTGPLGLPGNATQPLHAVPMQQVQSIVNAAVAAAVNAAMPIGTIIAWGGVAAPNSSWHLCDGTVHNSSALESVLAAGSLAPGFDPKKTPNLVDRFVVGTGTTGSYEKGRTGGANTVKLAANESGLVDHGHTVTQSSVDTAHVHIYGQVLGGAQNTGGPSWQQFIQEGSVVSSAATTNVAGSLHTHNVGVLGSGSAPAAVAHENRPPYYALVYIIKKA